MALNGTQWHSTELDRAYTGALCWPAGPPAGRRLGVEVALLLSRCIDEGAHSPGRPCLKLSPATVMGAL
jgi:hypothetical protein